MRIVFMGTPEFAVASLKKLVDFGHNVVAVVTMPDKMGGRGMKQVIQSDVKKYAEEQGIPVLQPKNLKSKKFVEKLRSFQADLQFVVAYRMLPEVVWSMPPLGTYNLHGSYLPKYRGAAPIQWSIMNGDSETGLTTFKLKHKIDTGDVADQIKLPIYLVDTVKDLHDRMMTLGASLVLKTVNAIQNEKISFQMQQENGVTKAPKLHREDGKLNLEHSILENYNKIRGMSPYPGAWTTFQEKTIKIYGCDIRESNDDVPIGTWQKAAYGLLELRVKDGYIKPYDLQLEGKRRMRIDEFIHGVQLEA